MDDYPGLEPADVQACLAYAHALIAHDSIDNIRVGRIRAAPRRGCAGARLARWLRQLGHDVTDCGSPGADPGDEALLQVAIDEDRILVTIDQDFGHLLFVDRRPHRVLVCLPDCPADERIAIFVELLAKHSEALARRAVITVRGRRVRISWTPAAE